MIRHLLRSALPSMAASALLILGVVGCAGESTSSGDQASSDAASTEAKIEAIFSGCQALNTTDLTYPEGKPDSSVPR